MRQPPSGGCVLKHRDTDTHSHLPRAAAFGRLCVETRLIAPSSFITVSQPPSGGCVLKLAAWRALASSCLQPPSGGCVLKHINRHDELSLNNAAAFGRLCVETMPVHH